MARDQGGSVHRGQTRDRIHHPPQRPLSPRCPARGRAPDQVGELREGRHHGVRDGRHDRLAPGIAVRGHDQEGPAAPVRAHRYRDPEQHVGGIVRGGGGRGLDQRPQQRRMLRDVHGPWAQDLDLLTLEHGDVLELRRVLARAVLDHHQARSEHLEHEAEAGYRPRGSPHDELALLAPDAEVDPGTLHGRREPRQGARAEGQGRREHEGPKGPFGGQEGQRDLGRGALLALKARPETCIDHGLDRSRVRRGHARGPLARARRRVSGEEILEPPGGAPGGGVERCIHRLPMVLIPPDAAQGVRARGPDVVALVRCGHSTGWK